jgi:hypothetical protein
MPPHVNVGCFGDFLQGLLHFVLAEIELAGRPRLADGGGAEGLGDRDERDGRGVPAGTACRRVDPGPDGREVLGDRGGYFLKLLS